MSPNKYDNQLLLILEIDIIFNMTFSQSGSENVLISDGNDKVYVIYLRI